MLTMAKVLHLVMKKLISTGNIQMKSVCFQHNLMSSMWLLLI